MSQNRKPRIVQLRGTSGSGKSTLVRQLINKHFTSAMQTPHHIKGRKRPLYTTFHRPDDNDIVVMGHYESACGGCDTISGYDYTFEVINRLLENGSDVLFEGLLLSTEFKRTLKLHEDGHDPLVLFINLPGGVEECVDWVNTRRRTKDPDKEDVNPANTIAKQKGVTSVCKRLEAEGLRIILGDREETFAQVERELGL